MERELDAWFSRYDVDDDGELRVHEVRKMLDDMFAAGKSGVPLTEKSITNLMTALDIDESGTVNRVEFETAWRSWLGRAVNPVRCLLIIDVQNDFTMGTMAVTGGEAIVPVINQLRAQHKFDVCAFSRDWHPHDHCSFHETFVGNGPLPAPLHPDLTPAEKAAAVDPPVYSSVVFAAPNGVRMDQMLWPRHCTQNSWGAENHPDLVTRSSDLEIHKGSNAAVDSYSAFYDNMKLTDTGLLGKLRALGVTHVYCVGIALDYCVASSALHAAEEGLCVTVVEDACAAVGPETAAVRKRSMEDAGITVCTTAELPDVMRRDTLEDVVNAASSIQKARKQSALCQHQYALRH